MYGMRLFLPLLMAFCLILFFWEKRDATSLQKNTPLPQTLTSAPGESSTNLTIASQIRNLGKTSASNPELRQQVDKILQEAKKIMAKPLVYRIYSLEELKLKNPGTGKRFSGIDPRTPGIEKINPQKAGIFALAMSDSNTAALIDNELPLLASAYVITQDHTYLDRIVAQLTETLTWSPLQRPGWTLYTASNDLPPGGNDGVWLATGLGLSGLSKTLQLLPTGSLPVELEKQIRQLMGREVESIRKDWESNLPWYVKARACQSNQWVVPISGLVIAATTLGRESHPEAYELGIRSLQQTLEALGTEGAVSEGPGYAMHWTAPFLYQAAIAARDAGDSRLADHGFLQNFPKWLAQSFQPGESLVNCFDHTAATRVNYQAFTSDLTRLAALSGDPYLYWNLRHEIKSTSLDLYGLLASGSLAQAEMEPPLWGCFQRAHYLVWRNSWKDDASGVWIRGGDVRDFHDHNDRGHVNFIVEGKTVLLEAGTSWYGDPQQHDEFQSIKGHNVLQVSSDIFPKRSPAPIRIDTLNQKGGDVTVEAGAGYAQVSQWTRHVVWSGTRMDVTDTVNLQSAQPILFRWHFGSEQPLQVIPQSASQTNVLLPAGNITFPDSQASLSTPMVNIQVNSDAAVSCSEEKDLDHALFGKAYNHRHTTLVVRSNEPVSQITIHTSFDVPGKP